jgi:hypothetical protein
VTDQPSRFQPATGNTEAWPTRNEYIVERALGDGEWVNESIYPETTPEAAEQQRARLLDEKRHRGTTFRIVRRTIASTVVAVRAGEKETP